MPKDAIPPQHQYRSFTLVTDWEPFTVTSLPKDPSNTVHVNDPTHGYRGGAWTTRGTALSQPPGLDFWIGQATAPGPYRQGVCYKATVKREFLHNINDGTATEDDIPIGIVTFVESNANPVVTNGGTDLIGAARLKGLDGCHEILMVNPNNRNYFTHTQSFDMKNWTNTHRIPDMMKTQVFTLDNLGAYTCPFSADASPTYDITQSYVLYYPQTNLYVTTASVHFRCRTTITYDCYLTKLSDRDFTDS